MNNSITNKVNLPFTSKILKAGALLPDIKTILSHWDLQQNIDKNLQRVIQQNLLGKKSRSRTTDVIKIFRQRYFYNESVAKTLAYLVKSKCDTKSLERIFFFHTLKADPLISEVVTEILLPQMLRGETEVNRITIQRVVMSWIEEGRTAGNWSESTVIKVTQGLLSTLRDFGILKGAVKKQIAPAYFPIQAFAYVAFCLKQKQPSGMEFIKLKDWKQFFLFAEGVERLLIEAHQMGLLEYHAAGTVTRLTFPASTLEEYAHVIA